MATKRKNAIDIETMVYGKVPPQAKDVEMALLGGILIQKGAFDETSGTLQANMFYVDAHQRVYKAMTMLNSKSQPIDVNTVAEQLTMTAELMDIGGKEYLHKLTNDVVSAAHNGHYSRIIQKKYLSRAIIQLCGEKIGDAYENTFDPWDIIDDMGTTLHRLTSSNAEDTIKEFNHHLVTQIQHVNDLANSEATISGVTSGFKDLDKTTYGWQKTDLVVLAARPAVGKTALALNLALNAAKSGTPVAFFSLEMSAGQLTQRIMAAESDIPLKKIQRGHLDKEGLLDLYRKSVQALAAVELYLDDTPAINILQLRAKCRRLVNKQKVGLIIIDYLQLMSGTGQKVQNREQDISEISRGLKQLAKELNVPIIALSQLSRETEKRASKDPILSDLRESGAIEQDADMVIFIYRADYYGDDRDADGQLITGLTKLKIAKHRGGTLETITLQAQLWIQKFVDYEQPAEKPKQGVDFSKKSKPKAKAEPTKLWEVIDEEANK